MSGKKTAGRVKILKNS